MAPVMAKPRRSPSALPNACAPAAKDDEPGAGDDMRRAMSAAKLGDSHPFRSAEARERYLTFYDEHAKSWPIASETRTVHTDDGETFMLISGPVDAPPLVLLPAGRTNSLCWTPIIEALSKDFRTYAVDAIYDDGRSVNSRPIKTTADATGWLDRLFDALGLSDGVNLMGVSFGGWLAGEYLLHAPERLAKVVWLAPAGVVLPMSGEFLARSMLCLIPSELTFRWVTRWIMADAAESDPGFVDDAVAEMALSEKCFKFRMWPGGGPRKLDDEELHGIEVPVLYLVGEHERICADPQAAMSRLSTVAPQIETAMIPGAGHDVLWVQSDAVGEKVLEFLGA
jgi:pimeloyl-ACP methyl ester carboxylesterase